MKKTTLKDWISEHGFSYRVAAETLGMDVGHLYRIVHGMQEPGRETLIKFTTAGISTDEWLEVKRG